MRQILFDICSFLYFTRNILKCYESSFHICNFSITGCLPRREHSARYPASQKSTNTLLHNSGVLINSWLIFFCSGSLLSQLSLLISKSLCFQRSRGSRAPPPHNRSAPKCLILVTNCFQSSKVSQRKWIKQLQIFFHAAQVPLNKQRGSYSIGHNNSKFANFEPIIWVMAASNILRYTHCIDLVPSPTRRRQIIINNSQIQPMNTWKSSNLKRHLLYAFSCQAAAWFDAEKT